MAALWVARQPLAMRMLDGDIVPGDTVQAHADLKKGEMKFERVTAKAVR